MARALEDVALLVVGAPTHALTLPRPATRSDASSKAPGPLVSPGVGVREWLARIEAPPADLLAATFDTRIKKVFLTGSAAKAARRRLRKRHVSCIDSQSFWVAEILGPLLPGEEERARRWAIGLWGGLAHRAA